MFKEASERLRVLADALGSGAWEPTASERTCAAVIITATPPMTPAGAILDGMKAAGPEIAPSEGAQFAAALVQAVRLLRSPAFTVSAEGQQLWIEVQDLMGAIIQMTPPPSWASRTR
ncbi:hypothetical protein N7U49_21385 [Streptomyces sp. AD2-2]|nr:hypothetical protein N7U49_21385 [Streptomyces sp. AD2-2]